MKHALTIVALAAACLFSSCRKERIHGDGPVVTETRNVSSFSGLDIRIAADVYFIQDTIHKLEIMAQKNILEVMETYVTGGKLVIKFENDVKVRSHDPIVIRLSAPTLNELRLSGSADVHVAGKLSPASMEIDLSGSGKMEIDEPHTGWLDASISGSGDIRIVSGTATEEKLKISGSGSMDFTDVQAVKASTQTSGSGDMKLRVSQKLDVSISGSGSVLYKGNPVVSSSISGSGKVLPF